MNFTEENVEDLLTRLRNPFNVCEAHKNRAMSEAANKIEELTEKNNGLQNWVAYILKLGQNLADVMQSGSDSGWDSALDEWEKLKNDARFIAKR